MGTRGIYGFRFEGQDKITYNHFDSYPSELGTNLINEIRGVDIEKLKSVAKKIILVSNEIAPNLNQIEECGEYTDTTVSTQTKTDWYCLLRQTQGTLKPYLQNELKYMIDSHNFILDSLFCEWGYIVNLDTLKFEIWKGFQEKKQKDNRYGTEKNKEGYYPCKLLKEYDLNNLPKKLNIKDS